MQELRLGKPGRPPELRKVQYSLARRQSCFIPSPAIAGGILAATTLIPQHYYKYNFLST